MSKLSIVIRKTTYPKKITKTIFFQLLFTFITISSLLFIQQFFITNAKNQYNYLDKNVFYSEFEERYFVDELNKAEQLADKNGKIMAGMVSNKLTHYDLSYWTSNYISYNEGTKKSCPIIYCNNIYSAFSFTSLASFELIYESSKKGLYINEEMAMDLVGFIPSNQNLEFTLYKDQSFSEYIAIPIAGVYRITKPNKVNVDIDQTILQRIYADTDILHLMEEFYKETKIELNVSAYYHLEKNIKKSDMSQLVKVPFNLSSRLMYEYAAIESFDNIFKVINIFFILSGIAMITSVVLLYIEKTFVLRESLYIEKIFYKSHFKNFISLNLSNFWILLMAFLISLIILLIEFFVIYVLYGYLVFVTGLYFILFIIIALCVMLTTAISYYFTRNESIKL